MDSVLWFFFALGLFVGSFLNVVVLRLNTGMDVVRSRSRCFSCGTVLSWYELIPLLSFVLQRGRCRKCKSTISWQYPIVELATGLLFAAIAYKALAIFGIYYAPYIAYYTLVFSVLLAITVYDIHHKIIPNILVYIFDALAFLAIFNFMMISSQEADFSLVRLATGLAFFAFFAGIWFLSKGRWMGFGDAKLALGLGWLLGPSLGTAGLVLSFWIGAAFGLAMLGINRLFRGRSRATISLQSEIPFAPFLVFGALLAFLFGIDFLDLENLFVLYVF
ncbi:MAG: prepilin peptidase [Parcubacteria group bacterium]|nr:prepilin peptidase [Parcubacteria group bacterium]